MCIRDSVKAEDIKDDGMLMFFLSRNEVDVCATYRMEQQIAELKKLGTDAKNIMAICFMGYDNDPREVYDIPAVQKYLTKLLENVPELLYYIDIPSYTFAILVNSILTSQGQAEKAEKAMLDYAKSIGDTGRVITIEMCIRDSYCPTLPGYCPALPGYCPTLPGYCSTFLPIPVS